MAISEEARRNSEDARALDLLDARVARGCEPQLAGHVAANLAVANDGRALVAMLSQLVPFIGYPRTLNALRVVNEGTSP